MFDFLQVPDWLITVELLMVGTGLLGYYMGQRGWAGIKMDITNAKTEIEKLKARFEGTPTQVVVAPTVPVTSG